VLFPPSVDSLTDRHRILKFQIDIAIVKAARDGEHKGVITPTDSDVTGVHR
jgi:hypothetical protein